MAWNEPDDEDRKNDPWGSRPGRDNQSPPDIDELFGDLMKKLSGLLGGKRGGSGSGSGPGSAVPSGMFAGFLLIAAVIWAGTGFYTVDEQERGVVLRLGRALDGVVEPGLRWNPPLIDEVTLVNVTRIYDQSFSNTMLTEDDNIVDITMTVQYLITDARKYYLEVEDPEGSLIQAAESAIRHVVGGTPMDEVINVGREVLAQDTRERLQSYLDNYGTGILVRQVNIAQSQPPTQVRAAFDDVIKAREDNQSRQNQARRVVSQKVPEARGEARQQIELANAYKEQVIAQAEGEASRFEQLLVEYQKAPAVTRERLYIDALEQIMGNTSKVMIDVEGGNNMMYLPLDQILQNARRSPPSGLPSTSAETGQGSFSGSSVQPRPVPNRGVSR
jgi:membrane protease subunit HflK